MRTQPHRGGPAGRLALMAAAIALGAAGCALVGPPQASDVPTTATTTAAPASPAVLSWTDTVCGAVVPIVQTLGHPPQVDVATPAATRDSYVAYLAQAQAVADRALRTVTAAGAAPVGDGEQAARSVRTDITALRDDLLDAGRQVEQVDVADPAAVLRSVVAVGNVVGAVGKGAQTLHTLDANPSLHTAFGEAESCDQLRALPLPGR